MSKFSKHNREFQARQEGKSDRGKTKEPETKQERPKKEKFKKFRYGLSLKDE